MNARGWGLLGAILETSHCIGNYKYMNCVMINSKYVYSSSLVGQLEGKVGKGVKIFP